MVNFICLGRYATIFFSSLRMSQFKIAVAVPPTNDVDVFTNDVGFIAIIGQNGELEGFNVTIGG